jgi:hypothetical protein
VLLTMHFSTLIIAETSHTQSKIIVSGVKYGIAIVGLVAYKG